MRALERAIRRAGIDIAYSEGFSPHPQISLAAPLPVGVTSRGELMDVFLASHMRVEDFDSALTPQLPPGLRLDATNEVPVGLPSLQSQLRAADYAIWLPGDVDKSALQQTMDALLGQKSIEWVQKRERDSKTYDLRPLILALSIDADGDKRILSMRLRAGNDATGRPDQVVAALGLPFGLPVERTRMLLAGEVVCS
jgi:radical SAM-linked protein